MKVKKVLGILLMLTLVLGLMPGSNGTAYAQSVEYDIYNTISGIINLSVKKNDSAVSQAGQGDTIKLTVSGNPSTGNVQGWSNFPRNIMIDGLAVTGSSSGTDIPLTQLGTALEWEFTMPAEDVFVTFPILTTNDIPVDTGKAAFRSIKSNGSSYQYTSNVLPGSTYNDPIAFLAYIPEGGSSYTYIYDDDSGGNSNNSLEFKIPSTAAVPIANGTYFHLGFGIYSTVDSGTFTPTTANVINFISIRKDPQVIEAKDLSIPYGTKGKEVGAKLTTGDGTLFYYVKNGDENIININRETGEITTKAVGSAEVRIEASETTAYRLTTKTITVTVKPSYSAQGAEHTIGDGKDVVLTVKGEPDDSKTYDNFDGVEMDGTTVSSDNYTTAKGSLILTLKSSYLDTLSVGDHTVTIKFNDGGTATAALKVSAAATPTAAPTTAPTPTPKPLPKTGDSGNPLLWLLIALLGVSLLVITVKQYSRK